MTDLSYGVPTQSQLPEGRAEVTREGSIVKVTLIGWITDEITEMVQQRMEGELMNADKSSIFIDGLYMNDPSLTSVLLMQTFHERMSERISKSAIAVPGYRLAFLSRLAFGKDESKYRVFYNSREEALAWLSS